MNDNLYSAKLGCYKLKENAKLPTKGSEHAACYDLYSCSEAPIVMKPRERMLIPTGLILDIPRGFSARIHSRSGLKLLLMFMKPKKDQSKRPTGMVALVAQE